MCEKQYALVGILNQFHVPSPPDPPPVYTSFPLRACSLSSHFRKRVSLDRVHGRPRRQLLILVPQLGDLQKRVDAVAL